MPKQLENQKQSKAEKARLQELSREIEEASREIALWERRNQQKATEQEKAEWEAFCLG